MNRYEPLGKFITFGCIVVGLIAVPIGIIAVLTRGVENWPAILVGILSLYMGFSTILRARKYKEESKREWHLFD